MTETKKLSRKMVIVEEEETGNVMELRRRGAGIHYEDEDDSYLEEDDSEYEDVDEDLPAAHTPFIERLRRSISGFFSASGLPAFGSRLYSIVASSAWVLTTTLIMVGLPVLYAYDREQNAVAMEREQQRFDTK